MLHRLHSIIFILCVSVFTGQTMLFAGNNPEANPLHDCEQNALRQEKFAADTRKEADMREQKSKEKEGEEAKLYKELAKILRDLSDQHERSAKAWRTSDKALGEESFRNQQELQKKRMEIYKELKILPQGGENGKKASPDPTVIESTGDLKNFLNKTHPEDSSQKASSSKD